MESMIPSGIPPQGGESLKDLENRLTKVLQSWNKAINRGERVEFVEGGKPDRNLLRRCAHLSSHAYHPNEIPEDLRRYNRYAYRNGWEGLTEEWDPDELPELFLHVPDRDRCEGWEVAAGAIATFRGTKEVLSDGGTNLLLGMGTKPVIREQTASYIDALSRKVKELQLHKLTLTGHSLGGFRAGLVGCSDPFLRAIYRREPFDRCKAMGLVEVISFDGPGWGDYLADETAEDPGFREVAKERCSVAAATLTPISGFGKHVGRVHLFRPVRHEMLSLWLVCVKSEHSMDNIRDIVDKQPVANRLRKIDNFDSGSAADLLDFSLRTAANMAGTIADTAVSLWNYFTGGK